MARTRKPHPQARAGRATAAPKVRPPTTTPASRKAAGRKKSGNVPPPDPLDGLVEAAACVLALPLQQQWRAAIKANLTVNLRLAVLVAEFALPDEAEPAPVFRA